MEVSNGDTLIETPLADIACLEISYDLLNSAQRSISNDVILSPGGVVQGRQNVRAVGNPIIIRLYYSAGYGYAGYGPGEIAHQKRLKAIEKRLHQLRRGCDEQS